MISAKVLVGFPTTGHWSDQFGMAMCNMLTQTMRHEPNIEMAVLNHKTSMLWAARQHFGEMALKYSFTHLLFIDTDQSFPASVVARLLTHQRAVVACNIATKVDPPMETACLGFDEKGKLIPCERTTGLEKVWRVGTGVMMIKSTVFHDIKKPWFPVKWIESEQRWQGEDWGFCEKLEKAGIPVWVDHDTSALVGHWGNKMYSLPRYEEHRVDDTTVIYEGRATEEITNHGT